MTNKLKAKSLPPNEFAPMKWGSTAAAVAVALSLAAIYYWPMISLRLGL